MTWLFWLNACVTSSSSSPLSVCSSLANFFFLASITWAFWNQDSLVPCGACHLIPHNDFHLSARSKMIWLFDDETKLGWKHIDRLLSDFMDLETNLMTCRIQRLGTYLYWRWEARSRTVGSSQYCKFVEPGARYFKAARHQGKRNQVCLLDNIVLKFIIMLVFGNMWQMWSTR